MAKRFTDSRKWDDPWFRKLPCQYKAFFIFLIDKCDHAGIWKVDFESAEFHIGEKLNKDEIIKIMDGRIIELKEKWFIPKFINFQYQVSSVAELNPENRVHKSVIDLLKKEGAIKGLKSPLQGCKDKDKDKDKDKGVVKGEVALTQEEHQRLIDTYGSGIIKEYIERLNDYALSTPLKFNKYHNHAAVIRQWIRKDNVKKLPPKPKEQPKEDLRYQPEVAGLVHKTAQDIGKR